LADRVHKCIAGNWKETLSSDARAVVESTTTVDARSGANDWLTALPAMQQLAMPDDAIRLLLRSRLRLDVTDAGPRVRILFVVLRALVEPRSVPPLTMPSAVATPMSTAAIT